MNFQTGFKLEAFQIRILNAKFPNDFSMSS